MFCEVVAAVPRQEHRGNLFKHRVPSRPQNRHHGAERLIPFDDSLCARHPTTQVRSGALPKSRAQALEPAKRRIRRRPVQYPCLHPRTASSRRWSKTRCRGPLRSPHRRYVPIAQPCRWCRSSGHRSRSHWHRTPASRRSQTSFQSNYCCRRGSACRLRSW